MISEGEIIDRDVIVSATGKDTGTIQRGPSLLLALIRQQSLIPPSFLDIAKDPSGKKAQRARKLARSDHNGAGRGEDTSMKGRVLELEANLSHGHTRLQSRGAGGVSNSKEQRNRRSLLQQ